MDNNNLSTGAVKPEKQTYNIQLAPKEEPSSLHQMATTQMEEDESISLLFDTGAGEGNSVASEVRRVARPRKQGEAG